VTPPSNALVAPLSHPLYLDPRAHQVGWLSSPWAMQFGRSCIHEFVWMTRATYIIRVCSECHELERTESLSRTASEWRGTIYEMIEVGAEATDAEYQTILEYLVRNYGAVAVNLARAEDLVTVLAIENEKLGAGGADHGGPPPHQEHTMVDPECVRDRALHGRECRVRRGVHLDEQLRVLHATAGLSPL